MTLMSARDLSLAFSRLCPSLLAERRSISSVFRSSKTSSRRAFDDLSVEIVYLF